MISTWACSCAASSCRMARTPPSPTRSFPATGSTSSLAGNDAADSELNRPLGHRLVREILPRVELAPQPQVAVGHLLGRHQLGLEHAVGVVVVAPVAVDDPPFLLQEDPRRGTGVGSEDGE